MSIASRYGVGINPSYKLFIGGEWVESLSGQTFDSINPATGKVLASFQSGNEEDIDVAVAAATKAFASFRYKSPSERSSLLLKIADTIESNLEEFAKMETLDNGKPIRETMAADIPLCVDHFRYFAGVIRSEEDSGSSLDAHTYSYNYKEPIGVVGQIIPWNFPLLMAVWKLAPALAAGNCIVLKPAEQTPLTILELMKKIQDFLPPGVINVVTGFGEQAGAPLVKHPGVKKIAFTGSTEVGKKIAKSAAESMKPVTLELGGKSPNIVFPDANLSKAVEGVTMGAVFNQGEVCTCGSRALIHEDIYEDFKKALIDRFEKVEVGDPMKPSTMIGAQVSKEQFDKISGYLSHAKTSEDCDIVCGGEPEPSDGYFIKPTIVETSNHSKLAQEEIFGPVLSLIRFKDEEEALAIANDTVYGLGAGVWTKDVNRIQRLVKGIEAGRVWVNNYHAYPAHSPFGGYKESGYGRETHKMALSAYQQNKNAIVSYSEEELGFYPA